nr:glutathione S transferase [Hymenolepis microstoma]
MLALDLRMNFARMCYSPDFDNMRDSYLKSLPSSLKTFEEYLGDKTWLTGDKINYPDFSLCELLNELEKFEPSCLSEFPKLKAYLTRFEHGSHGSASSILTENLGLNDLSVDMVGSTAFQEQQLIQRAELFLVTLAKMKTLYYRRGNLDKPISFKVWHPKRTPRTVKFKAEGPVKVADIMRNLEIDSMYPEFSGFESSCLVTLEDLQKLWFALTGAISPIGIWFQAGHSSLKSTAGL